MIRRNGITADLPLFHKDPVSAQEVRLQHMPKMIPVADDTRRLAHISLQMNIAEEQHRVLEAFAKYEDATNKEIANILGIDASTVSGRNYELRTLGLLTFSQKRICTVTHNTVTAWKAVREPK